MNEVLKLLKSLISKDAYTAIALVNKVIDDGLDMMQYMSDTIEILRRLMMAKINHSLVNKLGIEMGESVEIELNKMSQGAELPFIINLIDRLIMARQETKKSFIVQLPIELAIAEVCAAAPSPDRVKKNPIPAQNNPHPKPWLSGLRP